MEKESGHYSTNHKKFSKRKKKKIRNISYNERDFFSQLYIYFKDIDTFLFTNICTYHNLLMNALDKKIKHESNNILISNINYAFISKSSVYKKGLIVASNDPLDRNSHSARRFNFITYYTTIKSGLCYFRGLLKDENASIVRTPQDELHIRLKMLILIEDMKKYMKNSYPTLSLPYDKNKERDDHNKLSQRVSSEEFIIGKESQEQGFIQDHQRLTFEPEKISGEDIEFSIDTLLDNSEKSGIHTFDVPDMPHAMIKDHDFRDNYYRQFYIKLLKIFEDFSEYKIHSKTKKSEDYLFVKLITKDQLFIIKINSFDVFFKKSFQYIKKGTNVFVKAMYYHINNVMGGLSYNESQSILHDLNPDYHSTHEWTKELFDIEENLQIDFSDYGLDYYFEEDDEEWILIEKNIESIIKNFEAYLKA